MESLPSDPLEALSAIAQTINTLQDPDAVLEQVLGIAMQALEAERGFVLLTDATKPDGFAVQNSRNFTDQQLGEVARISNTVVQEVLRTGEPVLLYEALKDEAYRGHESIVLQQIQSIACVPLRIKQKLPKPFGSEFVRAEFQTDPLVSIGFSVDRQMVAANAA